MTIRDRGIKKWQGFFMPEHTKLLSNYQNEEFYKVEKPEVDSQRMDEMNFLLLEAMEYNTELVFSYFHDGQIKRINARAHHLDYINKVIRLVDTKGVPIKLFFADVVNIEKSC